MTAYYNEIEPFAAEWLRNLIAAGHIAPGDVDERSVKDVQASDLSGYTQCHFFAGIGVWSYALRSAGWSDDRPVWTGSCPCQPFSVAGRGGGVDDSRHLWPAWFDLIAQCRPPVVFGEQVSGVAGLTWFDAVSSDLEGLDYAVGAADLCAASVGAPHIRQRLYFVADDDDEAGRSIVRSGRIPENEDASRGNDADRRRAVSELVHAPRKQVGFSGCARKSGSASSIVGNASGTRSRGNCGTILSPQGESEGRGSAVGDLADVALPASSTRGFWEDAEWIECLDGKRRPVEPGTFPLAHGASGRVGRLRAYGNAIVAPVAETFIRAYMTS